MTEVADEGKVVGSKDGWEKAIYIEGVGEDVKK